MPWTFRTPPGWPVHPGWQPQPGWWTPDPSWPPAPPGWQFWAWEQPPPIPRLKRGTKVTGVSVLVGSILLLAVSAGFGIARSWPAIDAAFLRSPVSTPGTVGRHLHSGEYAVYERVGVTSQVGPIYVGQSNVVTITPDQVTVSGPDGAIDVSAVDPDQTLDRNGTTYARVVHFRASTSGTYAITLDTSTARQVIVAEEFGSTFRAVVGWLVLGFVSLLLIIVGAVLLANGPREPVSATQTIS